MSGLATSADLQRTESYQWPNGHISHLTESEITNLERFKQLCQEKGYYSPGDDKTPPTHDEETLLRYLRARKFIPQQAFKQFKDTEDWRRDNKLEQLYETIDTKEYEATRRLYPQWTGRRDKRGIPFYVFQVADLDSKSVNSYSNSKDEKKQSTNTSTPWKMLKLFALYENLCRFVLPLCSALSDRTHAETPISQSNNIVDISGVGFGKFWQLRNHMSDASNLATAHYPETLDRIFVVGAPGFFPTVWQWAQKWFDPITVSKIFILSNKEMLPVLEQYIDKKDLPKKYGGNLDWEFGDMPSLDPKIADKLNWRENVEAKGHKTFPTGPMKWQYDDNGEMLATAIGTEDGKPRNKVIAGLKPESGIAKLGLTPGRADKRLVYRSGSKIDTLPPTTAAAAVATSSQSNSIPPLDTTKMQADTAGAETNGDATTTARTASVPSASRENTSTVPSAPESTSQDPSISDSTQHPSLIPAAPAPEGRQGTSSTRYEQQASTHAAGNVGAGTPHVRVDAQGEKQGVMEPNTVGQAAKVHPDRPGPGPSFGDDTEEEREAQKGYVEQAKGLAGAVGGAVAGAVGLGSAGGNGEGEEERKAREEEDEERRRREDPAVDGMAGGNVEEFLRSRNMSQLQGEAKEGAKE